MSSRVESIERHYAYVSTESFKMPSKNNSNWFWRTEFGQNANTNRIQWHFAEFRWENKPNLPLINFHFGTESWSQILRSLFHLQKLTFGPMRYVHRRHNGNYKNERQPMQLFQRKKKNKLQNQEKNAFDCHFGLFFSNSPCPFSRSLSLLFPASAN